jgi:hypothetical protein
MKKLILVISVLAAVSCTKNISQPITETEKRQIEISVSSMLGKYFDDIKKNGLKAEFAYLDSTSDFFWVPPGYTESINYDSVKSAIEKNATQLDSVNNTWTTLHVHPLSSELASYTGNIHCILVDTKGKKTESNLIETGIVIKRSTGWKLLSGQTTLIQ